jgi:superfamily II DNA or RNA helicase
MQQFGVGPMTGILMNPAPPLCARGDVLSSNATASDPMMTTIKNITLRPVQQQALEGVARCVAAGKRRLLGIAPTGFGKTIVFCHLRDFLGMPTARVLIIAHRDELVSQAVEKYQTYDFTTRLSVEKGSSFAYAGADVVVASLQSLQPKRLQQLIKRWGMPDIVITDEAHHATASTYRKIYETLNITADGPIIHLGVTATPKRTDKKTLRELFDDVAFTYAIGDIIKMGHLAPLAAYQVQTDVDLDAVRTSAGDFIEHELSEAISTPERNARIVSAYEQIMPGQRALVFAADIAHSKQLAERFIEAGHRAKHVDGSTPTHLRRAILADFARGDVNIVVNCNLLTEGFDDPAIDGIILARPTKSTTLYTQMIGRGMRTAPGKTRCIVIDITDNSTRHHIMSVAELVGLPKKFKLNGKLAHEVKERYDRAIERTPLAAEVLTSAEGLERLEKIDPEKRMGVLTKAILDRAKRTQTYLPVDLLRPRNHGEEHGAKLLWVPTSEDRFQLHVDDNAAFVVAANTLNSWEFFRLGTTDVLGCYANPAEAFQDAEKLVREHHKDRIPLLDADAPWRAQPASPKQRKKLRHMHIDAPRRGMTKGHASDLIGLAELAQHS